MLYLKSLTINRFKSIKHSELLFSKGFTCIVGPNGSGKSNICDALLFGLGENALHRLRVDKLENLISFNQKRQKDSLPKAYVKLVFSGDNSIELLRIARADGKSVYKLNGKRMTRQEVVEELRSYKMDANETNTITQGEINKMLELSPKERRELIETTSGIREFESKKGEALKELDKVNTKIGEAKIMLNERTGFLDELEKEKEVAEKYMTMSARVKALNYSIIVSREKAVRSDLEVIEKQLKDLEDKHGKLSKEISDYNAKISELSLDRQLITKNLSESTVAIGDINKRLEIANNTILTLKIETENAEKEIAAANEFIKSSEKELDEKKNIVKENEKTIEGIKLELAKIKLPDANIEESLENQQGVEEKLEQVNKEIDEKEAFVQDKNNSISKLQADLYVESSKYESLIEKVKDNSEAEELNTLIRNAKDELSKAQTELSEKSKTVNEIESQAEKLRNSISEIDEKLIYLKEQRAVSRQGSGSVLSAVSRKFSEDDGFFGKASQLCTYDSEHAYAVEAAAGNRLEYLVVDSIETANRIIDYLRSSNAGRATFIPIKDVNVGEKQNASNLHQVLEFVKYEKRFEKVFSYIFYDTYLIDDVSDSRKFGVGRHRYVTLAGDLVEHSGIVSGGTQKKLSTAAIENMIHKLESNKSLLNSSANGLAIKLSDAKKAEALAKMLIEEKDAEIKELNAKLAKTNESISKDKGEAERYGKSVENLNARLAAMIKESTAAAEKLKALKEERAKLYDESLAFTKSMSKRSSTKKEQEKIEQQRKVIEESKVKIAELQKENQMTESRINEIQKQYMERKLRLKELADSKAEKENKIKGLEKDKLALEEQIKHSSTANKDAYEKLEDIEGEIAKLSNEQGKRSGEQASIESKVNELKIKKSQLDVRLSDIRAEISTYSNDNMELINSSIEEMERESSMLSEKINELGNVNLKAPAIYEEKKKDVEEVEEKVNTLEQERLAVLKMIEEIDAKKYSIFIDTFNQVSKNFTKLYSYIFDDKAEIYLSDEKDPFNSELRIRVRTKNNAQKRAESMSGGERSMLILMLVFAIHMYKPSTLYIFDEIDSALDKENSKKLSQLIKQLSSESQFIVVSHNDTLISNADTAIGVAKVNEESKIFGLQVSSIINNSIGAGDEKQG
jgi:chromosome segregation protein